MFRPSTKPKQKKEMKQKIIGISTIVIIAIIVGIVFAVNNSGNINKLVHKNKKIKALTTAIDVKTNWGKLIGLGRN